MERRYLFSRTLSPWCWSQARDPTIVQKETIRRLMPFTSSQYSRLSRLQPDSVDSDSVTHRPWSANNSANCYVALNVLYILNQYAGLYTRIIDRDLVRKRYTIIGMLSQEAFYTALYNLRMTALHQSHRSIGIATYTMCRPLTHSTPEMPTILKSHVHSFRWRCHPTIGILAWWWSVATR